MSMLDTENATLKWTLAHVRGDAEAYSNVSGELCSLQPVQIPVKKPVSPVYVFASMKRSFVDCPPPYIFERFELMSDNFCAVKEAPTPVREVGNTRQPVTEGPLMRGRSFRYKKCLNEIVFKQRSSYDTVVTQADKKRLFFDVYLSMEYKPPNSNNENKCIRLPFMP